MPPSASSSSRALEKASTTWVGEVKRHLPSFSIPFHWSSRSRDKERALPSLSSSLSRRHRMKEKPGTPWMHLLALDTRKSMPQSETGISTPPKEDMASTIKVRPASRTTLPTDWMSLRMPLVVSLWTMATWVMAGS